MRTIGWGVDRDVGTPRRRGPGRWQRLGILVVCLDLVVVGMVVGQLGVGTGRGVAFAAGGSDVDPIGYLGATLDTTGCQSAALNVGEGLFVICEDWSAITSPGGTTWVVSLYAAGNPVIGEYNGALPQALYWHETITEVKDSLGRPRRITDMYGAPTLVYMYATERYGSLELQFDDTDRLVRVNACLER
jgi:hypothetical protein